jgi:hypothetical protein
MITEHLLLKTERNSSVMLLALLSCKYQSILVPRQASVDTRFCPSSCDALRYISKCLRAELKLDAEDSEFGFESTFMLHC